MENELTVQLQIPYPKVRHMDGNLEVNAAPEPMVSEEDEEEKILKRAQQIQTERQRRAREAWQKVINENPDKDKLTPQELEEINKRIQRGEMPSHRQIAGGADGYFSDLNVENYRGSSIHPFAQELKEAGDREEVTDEFLQDLGDRARRSIISDQDEFAHRQFVEEVNAIRERIQSGGQPQQQTPEQTGQQPPSDLEQRLARMQERRESSTTNPRSIQQLARVIAIDEGEDRWGKTGRFPLLDENNRLIKQNFIKWFRERMMYHHINNSRNEQLRLGDIVGVDNEFGSTISVFSMDRNRAQYFKDEETGEVFDDLALQMKTELWLFGNMRNYDLQYQKYMGSDSDLPKFLAQIHDLEEITQPGSLEAIMTLPKEFGVKGDTTVGDAIRKSYEIYYYISDLPKLRGVLGPDSIFFKREGFENAFRIIEQKGPSAQISQESQNFIDSIFDGDEVNEAKFITQMNPFNDKSKPEFNKRIIREMVRQVVSGKYGLDNGLNPETVRVVDGSSNLSAKELHERDLVRKDLEYAEAFAWVLTRWTGAAARNDTQAIGFDALTKTIKFRDYRKRQSADNRAGQFGNEYDLPVFKGLTADFFNGITVEKKIEDGGINFTPFEIFRKISAIEDDPMLSEEQKKEAKEKWAKRLNFEQYIQRSYSADHINRGYEVFHSMMGAEELKLEEIVKRDPFQGVILDRGKFEEQVKEKFIKPIRYAFSTYGQLDMGKMTRVQVDGFGPRDLPVYKDVTMAESLFGPEVTREIRPEANKWFRNLEGEKLQQFNERMRAKGIDFSKLSGEEKRNVIWQDYLSTDGRSSLWKRAVMARIALQIKSHRGYGNGYLYFDEAMVNKFYEALETIKSVDIDEDENSTEISYARRFLTEKDIKWIRKMSGTTQGKMFVTDVLIRHVGWGALKGTGEGIMEFVRDIFK